jgi:HSP20 family protein
MTRSRCGGGRQERSGCVDEIAPQAERGGNWFGTRIARGARTPTPREEMDIMATLSIQKEPHAKAPAPAAREWWDPFRTMRELLRWDPFGEIAPRWVAEEAPLNVAFDVKETKDAFLFRADLPGIKPEDVDVKINLNRLTVSGKREAEKTDKGDTYYTYERSYGSFRRSFTLPEGVDSDKIEAELKDGVLSMKLPKKPESQPKQINVKSK